MRTPSMIPQSKYLRGEGGRERERRERIFIKLLSSTVNLLISRITPLVQITLGEEPNNRKSVSLTKGKLDQCDTPCILKIMMYTNTTSFSY